MAKHQARVPPAILTESQDWVYYRPERGQGFNLSPALEQQVRTWKLYWALERIAMVLADSGTVEHTRPVAFQSPQVWLLELVEGLKDGYGQLCSYYYPSYLEGQSRAWLLYAEGVFLFYEPGIHPEAGYPQFRWVLKSDRVGMGAWRMMLESEALEAPGPATGASDG